MYALFLDENNYILSATYPEYAPEDAIIVEELPEGDITDYQYIDDNYVLDIARKTLRESQNDESIEIIPPINVSSDVWSDIATAIKEGVNNV